MVLELQITDCVPLFPATIKIPGVDVEEIWRYLQSLDPLFTRQLPRTQLALRFYALSMEGYLKTQNRSDVIVANVIGDSAGRPVGIVFEPGKLLPAPSKKKKNAR